MVRTCFGRLPEEAERRNALRELGASPNAESIQDIMWSVLLLPEFQFIY